MEQDQTIESSTIQFYSLFYLNEAREDFVNLRRSQEKALQTYAACAAVQARLLAKLGANYQVITNSADAFSCRNREGVSPVDFRIEAFDRDVPLDIPFRSAHFKLDVIRAFGEGRLGSRPTLIDLDVLPVGDIPFDKFHQHDLLVYDISEQMTADVGSDRLISDLSFLLERPISRPIWYGGEFISGSPEAFSALSEEVEKIWPRYRENLDRFAHIGDETIVTAAVCELSQKGFSIGDLGAEGLVTRWWSARTTFRQPSLASIATIPFWHLPADKDFIAELDGTDIGLECLRARFAAHVAPRLRKRRWANPLLNLLRREQKHVARIN